MPTMSKPADSLRRLAWASVSLFAAGPVLAAAPATEAALASPASPAASAARAAAPASGTRVLEDDRVRIEETRVRGQLRNVTVHSKITGGSYEIIVGPGGRDPSQNAAQRADSAGQRAWSLLRF